MPSNRKDEKTLIKRRKILLGISGATLLCGGGLYASNRILDSHQGDMQINYPPESIRIACPKHQEEPLLLIAQEQKIFDKYALSVNFINNITTSAQAINALQNNSCDIAIFSILDWLPNLMSGLMAKLVVGISGGNFRLLVSKQQKIERLADFSGLKIATLPHAPEAKLFFSILLRRKGFNPDQGIQWVEMEAEELLPALLSNHVQGAIGHDPLMWKLLTTAPHKIYELAGSKSGSWSNRVNRVLGIQDIFLKQHPIIPNALAHTILDASLWQIKHLKETSILLADEWKNWNKQQILSMMQNQTLGVIPINNQLWEQTAQYIDELKLLGKVPNDIKSSRLARQFCLKIS